VSWLDSSHNLFLVESCECDGIDCWACFHVIILGHTQKRRNGEWKDAENHHDGHGECGNTRHVTVPLYLQIPICKKKRFSLSPLVFMRFAAVQSLFLCLLLLDSGYACLICASPGARPSHPLAEFPTTNGMMTCEVLYTMAMDGTLPSDLCDVAIAQAPAICGCSFKSECLLCGVQGVGALHPDAQFHSLIGMLQCEELYRFGENGWLDNAECAHALAHALPICGCAPKTEEPSTNPTFLPSTMPSVMPSITTTIPSNVPSFRPSRTPTRFPTHRPSSFPPSSQPSNVPSSEPTQFPSPVPSGEPSLRPSRGPSSAPSRFPTRLPSSFPTQGPSAKPSSDPLKDS